MKIANIKIIILALTVLICFEVKNNLAGGLEDIGTVHLKIINNSRANIKLKGYLLSSREPEFEIDVRSGSEVSSALKNTVRRAACKGDALIPGSTKIVWRIEFLQEGEPPFLAFINSVSFMMDGSYIGAERMVLRKEGEERYKGAFIFTKFLLGTPDCDEDESGWTGKVEIIEKPFFCNQEELPQAVVDQFKVTIVLAGENFKDSTMEVEVLRPVTVVNEGVMKLAEEIIGTGIKR